MGALLHTPTYKKSVRLAGSKWSIIEPDLNIRLKTRLKKGLIVSRNLKMITGTAVALIMLLTGWLAVTNVVFDPEKGIMTRGDLELSWMTPTENADSSPLTDLAGYTIYCWNAEDHRTETILIEDPAQTRYELEQLRPGIYQCAVSAIRGDGSQSALSNVITRSVH